MQPQFDGRTNEVLDRIAAQMEKEEQAEQESGPEPYPGNPPYYDQALLHKDLEERRKAEKKERAEEETRRLREEIRLAYKEANSVTPSEAVLDKLVDARRQERALEQARRNRMIAAATLHQNF